MTVLTDRPPPQLDPSAVAGDVDAGVIKEAHRRQHRRWLMAVVAVLVAGVFVVMIDPGGHGRDGASPGSKSASRSSAGTMSSPAKVFAQDPYMGVACHIANSIACDRVGLSVWLRRPAIVTATIAGASLKLNSPDWSYVTHDSRGKLYVYAGFLQPAKITTHLHVEPDRGSPSTWGANPRIPPALPPPPTVRFRIVYGHGDVVFTQQHVWLSMGWG